MIRVTLSKPQAQPALIAAELEDDLTVNTSTGAVRGHFAYVDANGTRLASQPFDVLLGPKVLAAFLAQVVAEAQGENARLAGETCCVERVGALAVGLVDLSLPVVPAK